MYNYTCVHVYGNIHSWVMHIVFTMQHYIYKFGLRIFGVKIGALILVSFYM